MAKGSHRRPQPVAQQEAQPQTYGHAHRGGEVYTVYLALTAEERREVLEAIGLKWCQRIGHRHKIGALRDLKDLEAGAATVEAWIVDEHPDGSSRAFGDLFDPLLTALIDRAVELLGENSDEPTTDQLEAMADALAIERSAAQVRLLLAAVVEFQFTAAPEAQELAARQERFALPESAHVDTLDEAEHQEERDG